MWKNISWQLNIWGNWDTERLKTFTLAQPRNKQCSLDFDPCLEDPEQKYFHNSLTDGVRADLPTSPGSGGIYMVSTGIHALAQLCPGVCQPFWLSSIAPFGVLNAASATFGVPRSPSEGVVWAELGANTACIGSIFIDDWWKERKKGARRWCPWVWICGFLKFPGIRVPFPWVAQQQPLPIKKK